VIILSSLAFIWVGCLAIGFAAPGNHNLDARRNQLKNLLADEWEYEMREGPEFASVIGDYRYNDRWTDISLAHVPQKKRDLGDWLARFEAVDTTGFPGRRSSIS